MKLIEEKTELESEKSELSTALATVKGELADLESKYQRLSKLFSKSRQRYLIQHINSNGWYVNQRVIDELPQLIVLKGNISDTKRANYLENMRKTSSSPSWLYACNNIAIDGFSKVWSFDMADSYFSELIHPNLTTFDDEQVRHLIRVMENNGQIRDRNRAETDMKIVRAALESRAA